MIPYSTQCIEDDDLQAVLFALKQDCITQGEFVESFENKIASFVDAKYALTFNSATSALNIAYKIIKDEFHNMPIEFITTPITFCATANMMLENHIKPVFCEIDKNGNLCAKHIESCLTKHTKAIVSVDYAGNSVEVENIIDICKKNNLYFISDSSHSFGGEYKGKKIGQFADMTIFSFHALKPITTIEGGAIITNNPIIYKKAKSLRSHSIIKGDLWESDVERVGYNFRLSDVACCLGISQLNKLDSFLQKRKEIAKIYDEAFKHCDKFRTLKIPAHIQSTHHLYPILLDESFFKHKNEIFTKLQKKGLGVQVHYKPVYRFTLYQGYESLKNAERFYNAEISIPCHQKMTKNDVDYVVDSLLDIFKSY